MKKHNDFSGKYGKLLSTRLRIQGSGAEVTIPIQYGHYDSPIVNIRHSFFSLISLTDEEFAL